MGNGNLNPKTRALQLNLEGLFKLLGGTSEERLRFWEIVKGITTPAQFRVVSKQIKTMEGQVKQVAQGAKVLKQMAGKIAKG